jgi:hypothetical protein
VTIGCPFDFVRTFWTQYFDKDREFEKRDMPKEPIKWLNVFSPLDVLGSNFRNDDEPNQPAEINVRAQVVAPGSDVPAPVNIPFSEGLMLSKLSWSSSFTLLGLRSHSIYWGAQMEAEVDCFSEIVQRMYAGHYALS